tara:strand:+ start:13828 stop:14715 length:888 start_codon:yes stop_codon:yes gene_type:complete
MNIPKRFDKLALGTVQFGLPYGVANQQGQVAASEVQTILNSARTNGIHTLDTAIAYGESECVLGGMSLDGFDIVTKLPSVPDECTDVAGWIERELEGSLSRLNVSRVDSLLLHNPGQLSGSMGQIIYKTLLEKKNEGVIKRVGVSVYSPDELLLLIESFQFDLIQAPFNIIDSRLKEAGLFEKLALSGTQLHVRSVFMQGLLLMSAASRPEKFNRWSSLWSTWDQWLKEVNLTPLQACLRYALSIPEIEKVVVGVDSAIQLSEILKASEGYCPITPPILNCSDPNLLNPSLWNSL